MTELYRKKEDRKKLKSSIDVRIFKPKPEIRVW